MLSVAAQACKGPSHATPIDHPDCGPAWARAKFGPSRSYIKLKYPCRSRPFQTSYRSCLTLEMVPEPLSLIQQEAFTTTALSHATRRIQRMSTHCLPRSRTSWRVHVLKQNTSVHTESITPAHFAVKLVAAGEDYPGSSYRCLRLRNRRTPFTAICLAEMFRYYSAHTALTVLGTRSSFRHTP